MTLLCEATWGDIEALRERTLAHGATSVAEAAQHFAEAISSAFSSVVLARVFLLVPFERIPAHDRAFATALVSNDGRLAPVTRVLSLVGTHGRKPEWCDRLRSTGHLAIPLLDRAFVDEAPMLARLLADLGLDVRPDGNHGTDGRVTSLPPSDPRASDPRASDPEGGISSRRMLGSLNGTFYVADAETASDARGRKVIPGREFVAQNGVHTVFGMGGAYLDGSVALVIVFTDELLTKAVVDRFPSLIGTFKIATARLVDAKHLYRD